jgi:phosphoglycerate kinase
LLKGGSVIFVSHFGRPKGVEEKYLETYFENNSEVLGVPCQFVSDCIEEEAKNAAKLQAGVLLLENYVS